MYYLCHAFIIPLIVMGLSLDLVGQDWANLERFQKEKDRKSVV